MEEQNQNNQENLKEEIEKIRVDYNKAKELLNNAQKISQLFEELKTKTEAASNDIILSSENIKPKKQEIDEIRNEAQNRLNEISSNLEKVKANIVSMQDSYVQFSEIKGNIIGRSGEIENLLKNATSLKDDIENIKNESQKVLESIKNSFADVQEKVQEMQAAYESFLQIKGKIDDENTGLKAAFDSVQNFKTKSETIYKEIQSYRDESKQSLESIKKNKDESEGFKNEIHINLERSQKSIDEINKITDLITDTGFANAFQKRAKKLFIGYCVWGGVLIFSVIGLVILLYIYFHNQNGEIPKFEYLIYRFTLSSPLLFLIGFAVSQYSKERALNEKYEFKAITATVIRNHIKFLIDSYQKNNDSINNFSVNIFEKIYNEPYNNDGKLEKRIKELENYLKRLKKSEINKNLIDLKDVANSVKELKTLIPDETLLSNIFRVFTRK